MKLDSSTMSPARLLHLLTVIGAITNDGTGVDRAFSRALEEICRFAGWPIGHAYVVSTEGRDPSHLWHVDDARRFASLRADLERNATGDGIVGRVLSTETPSWIEDFHIDSTSASAAAATGLRNAFGVPVLAGAEVAAALAFYATEPTPSDPHLLRIPLPGGSN